MEKYLSAVKSALKLSAALLVLSFSGCQDDAPPPNIYPLRLSFQNKAGSDLLTLNGSYTTPLGEVLTITAFKYHISNIELTDASGKTTKILNSYFLVDAKDPSSGSFTVNASGNRYKAIRFVVGVDSARNVSGVQTGALDPANGMFWTWNTGYIMAKLEGRSAASSAPQQGVTYHIGGYKAAESVLAPVTLNLPMEVLLTTGATSEIVIKADALAWFKGSTEIKIADEPSCMTPGPLAQKIAANYRQMFTVTAVNNN